MDSLTYDYDFLCTYHLIENELHNIPYGKRFTHDSEWVLL